MRLFTRMQYNACLITSVSAYLHRGLIVEIFAVRYSTKDCMGDFYEFWMSAFCRATCEVWRFSAASHVSNRDKVDPGPPWAFVLAENSIHEVS